MTPNNKAYVAGIGATISQPFGAAAGWVLTQLSIPPDIANPLGMAIVGLIVGIITYFVPNVVPPADNNK